VVEIWFFGDDAGFFGRICKIKVMGKFSDPLLGCRFSLGVINKVICDSTEGISVVYQLVLLETWFSNHLQKNQIHPKTTREC
jgi:hypothetical protein